MRFLNLDCVLYTNFHDFRLYENGELVASASLGDPSLLEAHTKGATATTRVEEVAHLVTRLASRQPQGPSSADELAHQLARATRVLRDATKLVLDREPAATIGKLKVQWTSLLFDDISVSEFADAYAQTVAYGLLTARLESQHGSLTLAGAAAVLHHRHPFLSAAFRLLTELEVLERIGWAIDVVLATVQGVGTETFRHSRHPHDPLLYFYEDFLGEYDSRLRDRRGVYYTPASVVDFQVQALAELAETLGRPRLLADDVIALDPGAGTGTYLLRLLDETARRVVRHAGQAALPAYMGQAAERTLGFELLVGPYTVAHQRVAARLRDLNVTPATVRVYLVDTLAEPHGVVGEQYSILDQQLAEERTKADKVKTSEPVMAVLGNPPYDRARGRPEADWFAQLMPLFTDPVRASARVNLKNLADPYVHYFRWALWKLFESVPPTGPRFLSFISNRSYLLDYAFEGLRAALRRRFDDIWIVDLEGESRGPRATENVFDIRVGVCIIVALRRDSAADERENATAHYIRFTGSRAEKEHALTERLADLPWTTAPDGNGDPFLPPVQGPWTTWLRLDQLMPARQSGVQTKRDHLVVSPTRQRLVGKLKRFADSNLPLDERRQLFHETQARPCPPANQWDPTRIRRYGYRPLSRHWLYDDRAYLDRPRPRLHELWHQGQRAFVTLPRGHGSGPVAFQHSEIPDLHAFRGSMGGHVFPLWVDHDHSLPNLPGGFLSRLRQWLGQDIGPEDVFAYTYGLLSAPAYSELFSEELAQGFPRVPFPKSRAVFNQVRHLGSHIQQIHSLEPTEATPHLEVNIHVVDTPGAVGACVAGVAVIGLWGGWFGGAVPRGADRSGARAGRPAARARSTGSTAGGPARAAAGGQ